MTLLSLLKAHLSGMPVEWHLCGGFAIDTFLQKVTRKHKDLDITVSFKDMLPCVSYLKSEGWRIVAPIGGGAFLPIDEALDNPSVYFDNIWCYREGASFITERFQDGRLEVVMDRTEQNTLDFIEVLFNNVADGNFYYLKNNAIVMPVDKAFQQIDGMSILSPEIILLYKTRTPNNKDYEQDFALTVAMLNEDQKYWLKRAMEVAYPEGHPWAI